MKIQTLFFQAIMAAGVLLLIPQQDARSQDTQENPPAAGEQEPDTFDKILAEFNEASSAFATRLRDAKPEERQALMSERPAAAQYSQRMFAVAERDFTAEEAEKALAWIAVSDATESGEKAVGLLLEHHPESAAIGESLLRRSMQIPTEESLAFLEKVGKESSDPRNRGIAQYTRVMQLKRGVQQLESIRTALATAEANAAETAEGATPEEAEAAAKRIEQLGKAGKLLLDSLPEIVLKGVEDPAAFQQMMEQELEAIVAGYPGIVLRETDPSWTISHAAEAELFEIRDLAIGKEVPEIEGEDIDGVTFKLSDYRGKVVVIDFWGDW